MGGRAGKDWELCFSLITSNLKYAGDLQDKLAPFPMVSLAYELDPDSES